MKKMLASKIHRATVTHADVNYEGSITLPPEHFMKVAEYAARSFKVNGFRDIVFIGDSTPNLKPLAAVASSLNREWKGSGARVHFVERFSSGGEFDEWLLRQGVTREEIGTHAGLSDTSTLMAINRRWVRSDKLAPGGDPRVTGVSGNPARSSVAYGKVGLELRIAAAVAQIQQMIAARNH